MTDYYRILHFWLRHPLVAINPWYLRKKGVELGRWPWISGWLHLALAAQSSLSIGDSVFIPRSVEILGNDLGRIELGDHVTIGSGARLHVANRARMEIGDRVGVGPYNFFNAFDDITIGDDTMFGPMVVLISADHGMEIGKPMREQYGTYAPISIGADCWIAASAVVLKGVKVGDGAVIGAGAVVTRDVPEYAVAAGAPARVIGERK